MLKGRGTIQKYSSQMLIFIYLSLVSKFPTFLGLRFHGEKNDLYYEATILTYEYKRMVPQENRLSARVKSGLGSFVIRLLHSLV